jgi:asparagine synthase (glutamine-hydrolysing)
MKIQFQQEPTLKLVGFSPESPLNILAAISNGMKPSSLKGDFILIAEGDDIETGLSLTVFISTVVAAVPYFLHLTESHCVHSENVVDCCLMAELTWEWNWDALAQLALFDSVLGDISLHRFITRIPKASIIKICGNKVEKYHEPFWEELYESFSPCSKLNEASTVLLGILSELPTTAKLSLSLSAGYDSRVLLACLSYLNLQKNTVTASMGLFDSTDPRIARQLADTVGFDFKRIELNSGDYLTYANDILKATSGEKLFCHWHTGIYTKKVGFDPQSIHLAGSNGEFARSYYFDKYLCKINYILSPKIVKNFFEVIS